MAYLKLDNNVHGIDYLEYRSSLYWGKFKYRAKTNIPRISVLSSASIHFWENQLKSSTKHYWHYWTNTNCSDIKQIEKDWLIFINKYKPIVKKCFKLKEHIQNTKDKTISIRLEGDTISIFSNDLKRLHELKTCNDIIIDFTEAVVGEPGNFAGIKYFVREPKHKSRIHLKNKRVDLNTIIEFKQLLKRFDKLYPSLTLQKWLYSIEERKSSTRYCHSAFSIDYDDESLITYLALAHGDLLGHRYLLEKRPDTNQK